MAANPDVRQMSTRARNGDPDVPPQRGCGGVPPAIPPHPPLQSGGWYRGEPRLEVLGPGRCPTVPQARSVAAAMVLAATFGPVGLCYLSTTAGLVATVVSVAVLLVAGALAPLAVIWPLSIAWAAIAAWSAGRRRRRWSVVIRFRHLERP